MVTVMKSNDLPTDGDLIYARFSSDNQRPTSIDDQVQSVREYSNRHYDCSPSFIVADEGESVKNGTAPNWERVLELVRTGQVRRVFVDESSRITRELQALLQVQAIFRHHSVALISVLENTDLTDDRADLAVIFGGYKNQSASRDARHRIRRSMNANLRRNLSNGDLCFGYSSVALTHDESVAAGLPPRRADERPYKRLVVVPEEAEWVRAIHRWFAVECRSIGSIIRTLNEKKVPRGGKAKTSKWQPINVRKILENRRYLGYRTRNTTQTVRNPETGKRESRPQRESERIEVHVPELAILTVAEFDRTQERLKQLRDTYGSGSQGWNQGGKSPSDYAPRKLLSGLIRCGVCGEKMTQTSGHLGGYYGCPQAPLGLCGNKTRANRRLAEKLIVEAITAELGMSVVAPNVHHILLEELRRESAEVPMRAAQLRKEVVAAEKEIDRLVDALAVGGSSALASAIRKREQHKAVLEAELAKITRVGPAVVEVPTLEWVESQLQERLPELLEAEAAQAALILREFVSPIDVVPETKPWLRKPHPVARFQVDFAAGATAAEGRPSCSGFGTFFEVPLRKLPFYEEFGSEVRGLHAQGMSLKDIARALPVDVSAAAVKLALNYALHGTPDPGDRAWGNHCRRNKKNTSSL